MQMKNILWIIGAIVVLGGLYWFLTNNQGSSTPAAPEAAQQASGNPPSASSTMDSSMPMSMHVSVTYNGSSFSPSSVTIPVGASVTFTSTAGDMWIASDPHPSHTGYDGTSRSQHCASGYSGSAPFDECAPGPGFTFTFNKVGTWSYHNHMNTSARGSVTVTAQ